MTLCMYTLTDGVIFCAAVHCHSGQSRSVALLAAHLMLARGWTLKAALDFIRKSRPQASPNAGAPSHVLLLPARAPRHLTGPLRQRVRNELHLRCRCVVKLLMILPPHIVLRSEASTAGPAALREVALQTCRVWLAGYLEALRDLEKRLHGACTVQSRRSKPEPRACPLCAERVGLSSQVPPSRFRIVTPIASWRCWQRQQRSSSAWSCSAYMTPYMLSASGTAVSRTPIEKGA